MALEVSRTAAGLQLDLTGAWGMRESAALEQQLGALELNPGQKVQIVTQGLTSLNLSGAWSLRQFLGRARAAGATVSFQGAPPDQLRLLGETLQESEAPAS